MPNPVWSLGLPWPRRRIPEQAPGLRCSLPLSFACTAHLLICSRLLFCRLLPSVLSSSNAELFPMLLRDGINVANLHHGFPTTLYCTVLHCKALYCTVPYCTIRYDTILCYTILYYAMLCYAILYSSLLYSTLQCCTVLYYRIAFPLLPACRVFPTA